MQYGFYLILIASALTLHWWITVPLLVVGLTFSQGVPFVVGTAILMDSVYGTNIAALNGLPFLYTSVFGLAACVTLFMQHRMLD